MNNIQNYELNIIFSQDTSAEDCENKINLFLKEIGAVDIVIDRTGVQKLAYPIKNHFNGLYYLVTFNLELVNVRKINNATIKLNRDASVIRFIVINQTDFLIQKSKEKLNPEPQFATHRELNKGAGSNKKCFSRFIGLRAVDYKDTEFLKQFTSPYAKMFGRDRTGSSAKFQRKISQGIKRARHMALIPFTAIHSV
jgi:small subunit ribosomal protein S18